MSKERKIQKDKVQSVKEWKNTKIQSEYLEVMENTPKKKQSVFLYFTWFFVKIQKNQKKQKQIRMQFLKNTKYKRKNESKISNIQNAKKNTNTKFQKYKIQRKYKFKNEPECQPHVHFGNQETNCKKNTNPTSGIFQTLQF